MEDAFFFYVGNGRVLIPTIPPSLSLVGGGERGGERGNGGGGEGARRRERKLLSPIWAKGMKKEERAERGEIKRDSRHLFALTEVS